MPEPQFGFKESIIYQSLFSSQLIILIIGMDKIGRI